MLLGANALIKVTPGVMIWTIICFLAALAFLKWKAFGPIQEMIDKRRERIRESIEEADNAREEARKLLEEHRKLVAQAKGGAEEIPPRRDRLRAGAGGRRLPPAHAELAVPRR